MTWTVLLLPLVGCILLGVGFVDVLLTVFHPQSRGGPIHRRQNRLIWRGLHAVAGRLGERLSERLLSLGGPLIVVLSLGFWGFWLILAFALLYYPWRGFLNADAAAHVGWVEVVYYSGYVTTTLGLGDIAPSLPVLRMLTVLEAAGGMALFAVATNYLLSLYGKVAQEQTLALELSSVFDREVETVCDGWCRDDESDLESWCWNVSRQLFGVVHAHGHYPVLQYFRPHDRNRSLLVQLDSIFDLCEYLGSLDDRPAYRSLCAAAKGYLEELCRGWTQTRHDPDEEADWNELTDDDRRRYEELLRFSLYDRE